MTANFLRKYYTSKVTKGNVFIGNVGDFVINKNILLSNLSGITASEIQGFTINEFKDVIFFTRSNFGFTAGDFNPKSTLRFIIDLQGNFKKGIGNDNLRNANALEFMYLPKAGQGTGAKMAANSFQNNGLMYLPEVRAFGTKDRSVGGGGKIFFDEAIEFDTGVTIDKLKNSTHQIIWIRNYNIPNKIVSYTITETGATYIILDATFPSHSNVMQYIEVWRKDSFLKIVETTTGIVVTGLTPNKNNKIQLYAADEYYNRANAYNFSVQTIANDLQTIAELSTGGTYVEFSISNPTPYTINQVEIYVEGVLNITINGNLTNAYAVNLNQQTSYNIDIVAKTDEGIDLISNQITATTTTTPTVYQNTDLYLKLDELNGKPIDIVNGLQFDLFGGVQQGVQGKIGNAYSFDGVDGYLRGNNFTSITDGDFTISAYVKQGSKSNNCIFSQNIPNSFPYNTLAIYIGEYRGPSAKFEFRLFIGLTSIIEYIGNGGIATNSYKHYVIRRTGSLFELFINNSLVDTRASSVYWISTEQILGGVNNNDSIIQNFKGDVDEFSIFNQSIPDYKISDLYNNGNGITI